MTPAELRALVAKNPRGLVDLINIAGAMPALLDRLEAAERDAEKMRDELRRVAVQGVTANPGTLHHYKCLACGGRWSGRPTVAEQHIGDCAAIEAALAGK